MVLSASVLLAWNLRFTVGISDLRVQPGNTLLGNAGPWILLTWLLWLIVRGAYSTRLFGAGSEEFKAVLLASALAAGSVGVGCYLLKVDLSRGFTLLTFLVGVPALLVERYVARKILHHRRANGSLQHRVVAVGGPSAIEELVTVLHRERYVGYEIIGACVPDGIQAGPDDLSVPLLGSASKTRDVCDAVGADTVLVTRGGYSSANDLRKIAWDLERSDIDLVVVPSLTDVAGPRIHMRPVAGLPLLHVEGPQVDQAGGFAKRAFDVIMTALVLLLLSPLLLVVAIRIKLDDGGPVLFRQQRVGRDGTEFGMIKFRSMAVDAETRLEAIRHMNEAGQTLFKIRDDPRVTRIGRFIRKYSIDELPQLLNVLKGEMSLVGPRPPLPSEVANYEVDVHRRLLVRPGMTGLWQVSGRSELSWKESVRLDLYYVDNWSMVSDLVIMMKTFRAVVLSHGAY
jgi:exopolysaccharide biosynthesis polyprenyl glycosylphosphotransferase